MLDKIAWIGLGNMGLPMVKNAWKHGFPVMAFNRTPKLTDLGDVPVASSVEDACRDASVVCIMVSDGAAVEDILFGTGGAVEFMKPGAVVVNMSTIGVQETRDLSLQLTNLGYEWMDAPVSGSIGPANEGTLVFLVGGLQSTFNRLKPFFLAMGKSAFHLGPVSRGAAMKLLINSYLGVTIEAVSECMAVANKAGLSGSKFLEILQLTSVWSPVLDAKSKMWESDDYPQSFALKHMAKDLGLMGQFATSLSAATPTITNAFQVYLSALANDLAELDMAGVFRETSKLAGSNEDA